MALPTFQAAGAVAESNAAAPQTISPAWPIHVSGDIALLIIESEKIANLSVDAGFKPVDRGRFRAYSNSTLNVSTGVFWCRATGSAMGAPTVHHTGSHVRAVILTFRGCNAAGNPWNDAANSLKEALNNSSSTPGGTTTDANCLVVGIGTNQGFNCSGYTNAGLANITERLDNINATMGGGFFVFTGEKAVAGSFGATTATLSGNSAEGNLMLALTSVDAETDFHPYVMGIGDIVDGTGITQTPVWPPGVAANDIGILIVDQDTWPSSLGTANGFVQLPTDSPQRAGVSGGSSSEELSIYWKRAVGGDANPVVNKAGIACSAMILTVRGCPTSGNPWDVSSGDSNNLSPSTSVTVPGVTTTKSSCLVLNFVGLGFASSFNRDQNFGTWANSDLKYGFELLDRGAPSGSDWAIGIYMGKKRLAGVVGATTCTLTNTGAEYQARITIAFKPATSATPADTGIFTLSGQAATLRANRVLSAATGVFSLAGQASTSSVFHRYILDAQPGAFHMAAGPLSLEIREGRWTKIGSLTPADRWTYKTPET